MTAASQHKSVAVRSGHKCGKSALICGLALWWVCTRPRALVVFTAPADHQVKNIIWPELKHQYSHAKYAIGGRLYKEHHEGLVFTDDRRVFGLTTDKPERFAGISGKNLLFLVDEASGFPEAIFEAVFGNMAGGGRVVLTGNPTQTSGTFYDAFHTKRDNWRSLHISSLESPNFHGGNVPGLATPQWSEWAARQWGVGTPLWDVRVLGNFPKSGESVVVPLLLIEAAQKRTANELAPLSIGVDPGRFGDDPSLIAPRRGHKAYPLQSFHKLDGPNLAGEVLKIAGTLRRDGEKPRVKIDVIGIGASCFDYLNRSADVEAVPVNSAGAAIENTKYTNIRAEMAFTVTRWLNEGGVLPLDEELAGDLCAQKYFYDTRNRLQIEPKDEIKKRLKRSPNRGDALALAVYEPLLTPSFTEQKTAFQGFKRRE